jgi:hypothetical protein
MRIGYITNSVSCEYKMHDILKIWLQEKGLKYIHELNIIGLQVQRIPDFLVWKPGNGLINIEAKCIDLDCMIKQIRDNAKYCHYSFAYIPDYINTSRDFKRALFNEGYGLIIYNYSAAIITEVLEAHQNKEIDRELQKKVLAKMDKELMKRKKAQDIDTQQILQI